MRLRRCVRAVTLCGKAALAVVDFDNIMLELSFIHSQISENSQQLQQPS
jgi:hypothetical protein